MAMAMAMARIRHTNAARFSSSLLATTFPKCCLSSAVAGDACAGTVYDGSGKEIRKKGGVSTVLDKIREVREKIYRRRIPPELHGRLDNVRSEKDIANVVEKRIIHSMLEGDFENLPGKGKPLQIENNPHVDPCEEIIYRVLAKNGFAPEWIELNKDIKFRMHRWRIALDVAWKRRIESSAGNDFEVKEKWAASLKLLQTELEEINRKVLSYNLQAPFGHQVFNYNMEKELRHVQDGLKSETKNMSQRISHT